MTVSCTRAERAGLASEAGVLALGNELLVCERETVFEGHQRQRHSRHRDRRNRLSGCLVRLVRGRHAGRRPASNQDDPLPRLLTPAQSVAVPIYIPGGDVNKFLATTRITVEDSTGRQYAVSRGQLRSMKQRIERDAADAANGEPFSLRIRSHPR